MRAMSGASDTMTVLEALETLGLRPGATPDDVARAFRATVKTAHPDHGGEARRLRRIVEAYRLLEAGRAPSTIPPRPERPVEDRLEITPAEAQRGGERSVSLPDGRLRPTTLPAGLRPGDKVRLDGVLLTVFVRGEDGVLVDRDHLHLTVAASPALLRDCGRLEVQTPTGPRMVWVSREAGARGLVRVPNEGLPARGRHGRGDLFVRLQPDASRYESPARAKRRRFGAAWAA